MGRDYATRGGFVRVKPIIRVPSGVGTILSFNNLVEAHVLRALRADHQVAMKAVKDALVFAEKQFGIDRLLLSPELRTDAGHLFLDKYGQLIDLSNSGQLAMRKLLEVYLKRVELDARKIPIRLYPFVSGDFAAPKPIVIDASIAFGRPILVRKSVSTGIIADRIDAGESVAEIAKDYALTPHEVEEAVVYERAA